MADLLDIAPTTAAEAVKISNGMRFVVHGLNAPAIAAIVARFPAVIVLLNGGNIVQAIGRLGAATGAIIAAGCGYLGDEEREKRANNLLVEDQLKLLQAIAGLTFPNGIVSFVEKLTTLVTSADEGAKPVKVRLKKSPLPSQPSSDAASRPNMQ